MIPSKYIILVMALFGSLCGQLIQVAAESRVQAHIYEPDEVTSKAKILKKPEPDYTPEALRNHTVGIVRLRLVFTASGKISDISVMEGLPDGLTKRAIDAVQRIKFEPATKDGQTVSQYAVVEYDFDLLYEAGEVSRPANITYSPVPDVTEEARRKSVHGSVVLRVAMTRTGRIAILKVVRGLPCGLTENAIAAARQVKFAPAEKNGVAVSVIQNIEFKF